MSGRFRVVSHSATSAGKRFASAVAGVIQSPEQPRTDNDVHLAYAYAYAYALADAAHALIAVQQAVGSWDIHF